MLLLLLVIFENFQTFISRSERKSVFAVGILANPFLVMSVAAAQALHISAMYIPWLRDTLQLAPISTGEWGALLLVASSLLIVMEFDKWHRRRNKVLAKSSWFESIF